MNTTISRCVPVRERAASRPIGIRRRHRHRTDQFRQPRRRSGGFGGQVRVGTVRSSSLIVGRQGAEECPARRRRARRSGCRRRPSGTAWRRSGPAPPAGSPAGSAERQRGPARPPREVPRRSAQGAAARPAGSRPAAGPSPPRRAGADQQRAHRNVPAFGAEHASASSRAGTAADARASGFSRIMESPGGRADAVGPGTAQSYAPRGGSSGCSCAGRGEDGSLPGMAASVSMTSLLVSGSASAELEGLPSPARRLRLAAM